MINVVATVKVREESTAEFEQIVAGFRPRMLADSGCLRYDLQRVQNAPGTYVLLESYDSSEALQRHGASAEFTEFGAAIGAFLLGKPELTFLDPVGEQL